MKRFLLGVLLLTACPDKKDPAQPKAVPAPKAGLGALERVPVDAGEDPREALYQVAPFTTHGPQAPANATRVDVEELKVTVAGAPFDASTVKGPLVLVMKGETFLAQVADLLAQLDDAHAEVYFAHPDGFAYPVKLRDEPAFQAWLDEPSDSGRVRIIHRADGFELQTSVGKLAGPDRNGPTVPVRGGQMDLATLQRGLERVKGRFTNAGDYCVVPSFAMSMVDVVRGFAANYASNEASLFPSTCLVYPRPRADAGSR